MIIGDLRGVYLAWLKAAETAFLMGNIDADTLEPPVPEGLNDLSPAQQALVQYLEINEDMIAVAGQKSQHGNSGNKRDERSISGLMKEAKLIH